MMKYSMVCAEGHEPETLMVEADSEEEAMMKMIAKAHEHHRQRHADNPELVNMSDEDVRDFVMNNWTKA